jgi:cyclophilin family peptidyl-prolyl cis-trans isomerase
VTSSVTAERSYNLATEARMMRVVGLAVGLTLALASGVAAGQGQTAKPRLPRATTPPAPPVTKPVAPAAPAPFITPFSLADMSGKQAVLTTATGDIVIDLLPEHAPNHVGLFIKTAREGGFAGTTFHRVVRQGIVQGGDPFTKDPATRAKAGTGGLNLVAREGVTEKHTRGAVSAVIVPGRPDSGGTQFFICIVDQPSLDGQHTVFGRVSEGLRVAQRISEGATDDKGAPVEPVTVTAVVIRDKPADLPPPFSTESVETLSRATAVLETSAGDVTIGFTPDKAPEHVRNFLRLASLGAYDGTTFHRVVKGFVIQGGMMDTRKTPLTDAQERQIHRLKAEFNDQLHDLGVVSMARQPDPDSASTSFFIVTARAQSLDGQYTVFGKVLQGLDVVKAIEGVAVNGEKPAEDVILRRVRIIAP